MHLIHMMKRILLEHVVGFDFLTHITRWKLCPCKSRNRVHVLINSAYCDDQQRFKCGSTQSTSHTICFTHSAVQEKSSVTATAQDDVRFAHLHEQILMG